MSSVTETVG